MYRRHSRIYHKGPHKRAPFGEALRDGANGHLQLAVHSSFFGEVSVLGLGRLIAVCLAAMLISTLWPQPASAAEPSLLQQTHPWGRFAKGSWRRVIIVTETFDEQGKLANSSTTDSKTTLEEVTPERVTLRVEVTMEVAGQRIPSQPQVVKQGYAGESIGQTVSLKPLGGETIVVEGREIPCQSEEIEIAGAAGKEVTQISFANLPTPLVLRRKSTTTDPASGKTSQESTSEVWAIDKPVHVLDDIQNGYAVRVVQKNEHGVTTTWSDNVPSVPGEVVSQSSRKLDSQGRIVRRSTTELVGYGAEGESSSREPVRRPSRRTKRAR